MQLIKQTVFGGVALVLAACTTLKDFESMDTLSRTEFVCARDSQVRSYEKQQQTTSQRIDAITKALDKGYRMVESCAVTTVTVPKEICTETVVDSTVIENQQTTTTCTTIKTPAVSETCQKIPVTIDAAFEQKNQQDLQNSLPQLKQQRQQAYMTCFNKVGAMTPEQAYQYYKHN